MSTQNRLMSLNEVNQLIDAGRVLTIAAHKDVLKQLQKGNWIGGSIPYFMDKDGGTIDYTQIFVTDVTDIITDFKIKTYTEDTVTTTMLEDRYTNGFSLIILPAFSSVHQTYALKIGDQPTLFDRPIVGWVAGTLLDEIGSITPNVVNGATGEVFENGAVVLHGALPDSKYAEVDLVNIYEQGDGDTFTFEEDAFNCIFCNINGQPANLAQYYVDNNIDLDLPLVADYAGASINISVKHLNEQGRNISFLGPVLHGKEYRVAKPVEDKFNSLCTLLPEDVTPIAFSCNCAINYAQMDMEHKFTGALKGPFTFGEIAYILVNQAMVTLSIREY
ncbi:MAG: hypothetical protein AB8E82_20410 [Aureispira sp.]